MGFFKKLFGLEKEEISEVIKKENIQTFPDVPWKEPVADIIITPEILDERTYIDKPCELCNKTIGLDHYTKKGGLLCHKTCYKDKVKKLKQAGKIF